MRAGFVSLIVFLMLAVQAAADTRFALVVANGLYKTAALSNPRVDADMVSKALRDIGFDVTVVEDVTLEDFDHSLADFAGKVRGADLALFYFAGHGFAVSDRGVPRNYLMSVDADVTSTSERVLRAGGMPLDDVILTLSQQAHTSLVFIDACRNDPRVSRALGGAGRSAVPIDNDIGDSIFVGMSTRSGDVAADGTPGKGSPFARAFSAKIGTPGARLDDTFTQIRLAVESETRRDQRPDVGRYDLPAPLILNPKGTGQAVANQPATQSSEVIASAGTPAAESAPSNIPIQETGRPKLTQRLNADGTEGEAGASGNQTSDDEGVSVAVLTSRESSQALSPPPGEPTEQSESATPAHKMLAVIKRAIFYEERTSAAQGTSEPGTVIWSQEQESPGGDLPLEPAIRADATIPGKDIQLRMTIRRNGDKALPASHVIEMIFLTPQGFEGGGIDNVLRIALKNSEQDAGNPLLGIPAKIADGFFLIALNDGKNEIETNLNLLQQQSWIDIPIVYKSGRRALFTLEMTDTHDGVIDGTIMAWR